LARLLEWPLGRFFEHTGSGRIIARPPPGISLMTPETLMTVALRADTGPPLRADTGPPEGGLYDGPRQRQALPPPLPRHLPIGGEMTYRFGPGDVAIEDGRFATERTVVTFDGVTA